jgi:hypothetical protein
MDNGFVKVYFAHEFGGKQENFEHMDEVLRALYSTIGLQMSELSIMPISPLHMLGFAYQYVPYEYGMEMCLNILSQCAMMVTIDGYDDSRGVNIERDFCKKNNIQVVELKDFIDIVETIYSTFMEMRDN